MDTIMNNITEILILIFLTVTFLQSGVDKIIDWKGNLDFISDHFKNSPLKGMVPLLLFKILVLEVAAGILMAVGTVQLGLSGEYELALYGLILSAITLIFLLTGQRLAKDYAGAVTIVIYFIPTVFGIYLLAG